jgi:transcriptional regulator with XRE-family HTH domain
MKLKDYIDKHDLSLTDFAAKIGVGYYTLQRYVAGTRFPGPAEFAAIYKATNGTVQPNDFYDLKLKVTR